MPELPEVETTRKGIQPYLEKTQITDVTIRNHSLRWPIPEDLAQTLSKHFVIPIQDVSALFSGLKKQ